LERLAFLLFVVLLVVSARLARDLAWSRAAGRALGWERRVAHLHVAEAPAREVVEELSRQSGAKIIVRWDDLAAYGTGPSAPVRADVDDVSVSTALHVVFDPIVYKPVRYAADGDRIVVYSSGGSPDGPGGATEAAPQLVVRVYDTRDLFEPFSPELDFPPPPPPLPPRTIFGRSPEPPRQRAAETLVALVEQTVRTGDVWDWADGAPRSIYVWAWRLVVVATEQEQRDVESLLRRLRAGVRVSVGADASRGAPGGASRSVGR
jgi:hypothetical protein